jgi:hypothetical protein
MIAHLLDQLNEFSGNELGGLHLPRSISGLQKDIALCRNHQIVEEGPVLGVRPAVTRESAAIDVEVLHYRLQILFDPRLLLVCDVGRDSLLVC